MKNKNVSSDIIPVSDNKEKLATYLKELQPTGSLLLFTESVARGLSDSEKGDMYTTSQLKAILKKSRL